MLAQIVTGQDQGIPWHCQTGGYSGGRKQMTRNNNVDIGSASSGLSVYNFLQMSICAKLIAKNLMSLLTVSKKNHFFFSQKLMLL